MQKYSGGCKSKYAGKELANKLKHLISWSSLVHGWTKCNSDKSIIRGGLFRACGGLFRNESGEWLLGFMRKLGTGGILGSKLWSILTSLEIAWQKNFKNVWIEVDSKTADFDN